MHWKPENKQEKRSYFQIKQTSSQECSKERHDLWVNGIIQEEVVTIINTYTPNHSALNSVKQAPIDIKDQININQYNGGPQYSTITNRSTEQNVDKETDS